MLYGRGGGERRWRHQDFGCYGVELMGLAPRVACAEHGVVAAQVPWRSRTAGSPVVSRWSARGRRRSPARRPWADSHASRGGRPAISRAGSPPAWNPRCRACSTVPPR
ncbi:hypothetical protein HMPREF3196_01548 [Bifidobacterium bifidum]|uniref:Uncharacterized protein n=1 Tax=Bifidobacterium bifidum TaxID=1681 RepID=A0A133KMK0_BIFBI|nr:hypothetical protein HMPREF3196_01548 [Bifidobacterium bifidum]